MVEEAQASSANIQRIADRVTAYFVPAVIIIAFLAFFGWWAFGNFPQGLLAFIAVLIFLVHAHSVSQRLQRLW